MERPLVTVGALVFDPEGRILLVKTHKWGGRYGLPGGKIDRGEPMADALLRELREETGLLVRAPAFVMAQDCIDSPEFHKPVHMVLLNFRCESAGGEVSLNEEAQAYRWLSPEAALALDLNTPTRRLIEAVMGVPA